MIIFLKIAIGFKAESKCEKTSTTNITFIGVAG
jgi:hypothetical protein